MFGVDHSIVIVRGSGGEPVGFGIPVDGVALSDTGGARARQYPLQFVRGVLT